MALSQQSVASTQVLARSRAVYLTRAVLSSDPTAAVAVHAKWTVFLALVLFPRGLLFVVAVTVAATVVVTGGRALLTSLS